MSIRTEKKMKITIAAILLAIVATTSAQNLCDPPSCEGAYKDTLWPTRNRDSFYQCAPFAEGIFKPVRMPCPHGLNFDYGYQVCVWPWEFQDVCGSGPEQQPAPIQPIQPTLPPVIATPAPVPVNPRPPRLCDMPQCNENELDVLWPMQDPREYYECVGLFNPVVRRCTDGLYFGFFAQACAAEKYYQNMCPEDFQ